jgi:hypothetical protein
MIKRGFGDAVLWVLAGNHRAERSYRADGWTPDGGRSQDEVWGVRPTNSAIAVHSSEAALPPGAGPWCDCSLSP